MDYDNGFILQKTVDWSLLNDGMTIPVTVCSLFTSHHIDYFTRSQNNYSTNIIIISPRSSSARLLPSGRKNYHRIIHKKTLYLKKWIRNIAYRTYYQALNNMDIHVKKKMGLITN